MAGISNGNLGSSSNGSVARNGIAVGSSSTLEEPERETDILIVGSGEPSFQPLHLYIISLFNCALLIAFAALIWVYPGWPFPSTWADEEQYVFILISANGVVWLCSTISDRLVSSRHHVVRRRGYLNFYTRLEFLRRMPFYTFSATSVSLATVLGSCMRYIPESTSGEPSRLLIIQGFLSIQILLIFPFYFIYTVVILRFNCAKPPADVDSALFSGNSQQQSRARDQNDAMLTQSTSLLSASFNEVGVRDEPPLEQLLDRQADLITFYRQRNDHLLRKLALLSSNGEQRLPPTSATNAPTNSSTPAVNG